MPKKSQPAEEQIIDLLEKQLIFSLYSAGIKRDDITKILVISSRKVSAVTKYLKQN